ncbi:MAG: DUF4124 domain-containing protein [Desulfobacterales bacterium]
MMKLVRWLIFLVIVFFSMSTFAEFYRYVDEEGNVHYTDDLSKVPKNQQADIYEYTESQNDTDDYQKDEQNRLTSQPSPEEKHVSDQDETTELAEIKRDLDRKKVALEKEYQALMKEKEQLANNKNKIRSTLAARKHNKKVSEFNEKIADYEARKKIFNAEVEQYNVRMKKDFFKSLEASPQSEQ